jgi:isopentenyl phosphate kinase
VERALEQKLVPVVFGDVVPDEAWGFSILSADTLASELARGLPVGRVVFASDVPGIYPGSDRRATSIAQEVTEELLGRLAPRPGGADVTGGIRAKAEAMRAIARDGADAVLISGLSDGALLRAVRGEAVYGSWAHARAP